jgi:hypothetical protein
MLLLRQLAVERLKSAYSNGVAGREVLAWLDENGVMRVVAQASNCNSDATSTSELPSSSFQALDSPSPSINSKILELFCHILGDPSGRIFSIEIPNTKFVDSLKDAIKAKKSPEFNAFAADTLDLYQVSISIQDFDTKLANARSPEAVEGARKLLPTERLRNPFSSIKEDHIHVILQRPKGECHKLLVDPHRHLTILFVIISPPHLVLHLLFCHFYTPLITRLSLASHSLYASHLHVVGAVLLARSCLARSTGLWLPHISFADSSTSIFSVLS